jgi:hypothetical protein
MAVTLTDWIELESASRRERCDQSMAFDGDSFGLMFAFALFVTPKQSNQLGIESIYNSVARTNVISRD